MPGRGLKWKDWTDHHAYARKDENEEIKALCKTLGTTVDHFCSFALGYCFRKIRDGSQEMLCAFQRFKSDFYWKEKPHGRSKFVNSKTLFCDSQPEHDEMMSATECASIAGLTYGGFYRRLKSDKVRHFKFGRVIKIRKSDFLQWLKSVEVNPNDKNGSVDAKSVLDDKKGSASGSFERDNVAYCFVNQGMGAKGISVKPDKITQDRDEGKKYGFYWRYSYSEPWENESDET